MNYVIPTLYSFYHCQPSSQLLDLERAADGMQMLDRDLSAS